MILKLSPSVNFIIEICPNFNVRSFKKFILRLLSVRVSLNCEAGVPCIFTEVLHAVKFTPYQLCRKHYVRVERQSRDL